MLQRIILKTLNSSNLLSESETRVSERALRSASLSSAVCGRRPSVVTLFCWRCECSRWPSTPPREGRRRRRKTVYKRTSSLLSCGAEWVPLLLLGSQRHFASVYCRSNCFSLSLCGGPALCISGAGRSRTGDSGRMDLSDVARFQPDFVIKLWHGDLVTSHLNMM